MIKKYNKGFSLIELLTVIVIIVVISLISVPVINRTINSTTDRIYKNNERALAIAAENYYMENSELLPNLIGDMRIILIDELIETGHIKKIKNLNDKSQYCNGYVLVEKTKDKIYNYTPFLKCGNEYISDDYNQQLLTSVDLLVVAGGGGGGSRHGGGGGAGGLIFQQAYSITPGTPVNIKVGKGGQGAPAGSMTQGTAGENSSFGGIVAIGGGFGTSASVNGGSGGSGGGGRGNTINLGGSGTPTQGNGGGAGTLQNANNFEGIGGGGGGYSQSGSKGDITETNRGKGGNGVDLSLYFGTNTGDVGWFAGGGGAGGLNLGGNGGNGGGGDGNTNNTINGMANTGGGGGAGGHGGPSGSINYPGGNGGLGVVIVRYLGEPKASGGIIRSFNGYTIHIFTQGISAFNILPL